MPNWCQNQFKADGPLKDMRYFHEALKSIPPKDDHIPGMIPFRFSLSGVFPLPKAITDQFAALAWFKENWGTDGDVGEHTEGEYKEHPQEGTADIWWHFLTAWSPPVKWLEKVSRQYPAIEFELVYCERGNNFAGIAVGEKGKVSDESHDITKEDMEEWGYEVEEDPGQE